MNRFSSRLTGFRSSRSRRAAADPQVRQLRWLAVAAVAVWLAGGPSLQAQSTTDPPAESFMGRFSIGGRVGFFANDLMNSKSLTIAETDPALRIQRRTSSTASRLSGGATVEVAVADKISLSLDVLYRKVGYNTLSDINQGVDDPETSLIDERVLTSEFQSTRANYWDVPMVARFYNVGRLERRPRAFFDFGVAIRRVSNIRTFSRHVDPEGSVSESEGAATPANSQVLGVVAGGGLQFPGASGMKITPEVRYTRWTATTFDAPPTQSRRNQVEILLGITF